MLIPVLVLGGVGAAIAIAALIGRSKPTVSPPAPSPMEGTDEKRTESAGNEEGTNSGGGTTAKLIEDTKAKVGSWLDRQKPAVEDPLPQPDPKPVGPDPYSPAPVPIKGQYYQVVKGDTMWDIARAAYDDGSRWPQIAADTRNDWMRKPPATKWKGGLYARYSGWNTAWNTGTQYGVIFIP